MWTFRQRACRWTWALAVEVQVSANCITKSRAIRYCCVGFPSSRGRGHDDQIVRDARDLVVAAGLLPPRIVPRWTVSAAAP